MIRRYKDWQGWLDGLRSRAMKAGAEAISTNLGGLVLTNGVASIVPVLEPIAMSWQTAIATTLIQFALRVVIAASDYVAEKPDPDFVSEEVNTDFIAKDQ